MRIDVCTIIGQAFKSGRLKCPQRASASCIVRRVECTSRFRDLPIGFHDSLCIDQGRAGQERGPGSIYSELLFVRTEGRGSSAAGAVGVLLCARARVRKHEDSKQAQTATLSAGVLRAKFVRIRPAVRAERRAGQEARAR